MSPIRLIAHDELRLMRRNRVAVIALMLLVLLTLMAAITAWTHQRGIEDLRARFQTEADQAFDTQPDRHPHRVVHFGHFIFRPLGALAAFDPGVDAFTGNSMFLEGHRQNTANFGDVRQSSILIRFGQLTPAFVLQTLAPLLLIFLGYGALARERERGTLRQLLVQGVSGRQLFAGKAMALGIAAIVVGLPAMIGFALIAGQPGALAGPMAVIASGYAAWLFLWVLIVMIVSARVRRPRDALLALLAIWTVMVMLLPRAIPDLAGQAHPIATKLETDIAIQRDLRAMGDSHNADDPFFSAFKQRTLDHYGVSRVEDLPVNYKGLLAVEGEKLTSGLFDRYAAANFGTQAQQSAVMHGFGVLSPAIALRQMSMAAAGTDLAGHRQFLDQAEAYRFDFVQRLNRLQADAVSYADDTAKDPDADRRKRIAGGHWVDIPDFIFRSASASALVGAALPGLMIVMGWLLAALATAWFVSGRLQELRA